MRDSSSTKILRIILDIICVLLIIAPTINVWLHYLKSDYVNDIKILGNIILLAPFCLCWTFSQLTGNRFVKEILEIFAFVLTIIYACLAIYTITIPQSSFLYKDYLFNLESYLFLSLFILMAILFFVEKVNYKKAMKKNNLDDVLDSGVSF